MTEPSGTRPFAAFEWMLSLRYLQARRKEGFISVNAGFSFLGIMLGVATLIIVMAVLNGFRKELLDKLLGLNGHLVVQPLEQPLTDWERVAARIARVHGVTLAIPTLDAKALVSTATGNSGVLVRGIRPEDLGRLGAVAGNFVSGPLSAFEQGEGLAIGRRLAEKLGVGVRDNITLMTPRGVQTPFGYVPRIKAYPVAVVFETGMFEMDGGLLFMPLVAAQAFFDRADDVGGITVYVDDPQQVDRFRTVIADAAARPVAIADWRQLATGFFAVLQVQRNVMFLIVAIIVIVAAFNTTSSLIMLVKDKAADIGILRTIGATAGAIMRVFLVIGISIGAAATAAGVVLGALVSLNVEAIRQLLSRLTGTQIMPGELYFVSRLRADMDVRETMAVVAMALTLSLVATLYPSWRAARLDPVTALRYE